jgi:hypothetical protein
VEAKMRLGSLGSSSVLFFSVVLGAACLGAATTASAGSIFIDFEGDTVGAKPNGFVPTGISGVTLSDTSGQDLFIENFGAQGSGQRSLYTGTDMDRSALGIALAFLADQIALDFGNDDPHFTNDGDLAVLRLFHDATEVGLVTVVLNRNDAMDQTISFGAIGGGILFNRATFAYTNRFFDLATGGGAANVGLSEVVDNITIDRAATTVPEPGTLVLLAAGLAVAASSSRRRRRG